MPEITVHGLEETRARLQNLDSVIIKNVKNAIENRSCVRAVGKAKQFCTPGESPYEDMVFPSKIERAERKGIPYSGAPFQIGDLRRNISSKVVSDANSVTGVIGTNSDYAVYVHEGTSRMWARPFLQDAVIECQQQTIDDVNEAIRQSIQEAGLQSSEGFVWGTTPSNYATAMDEGEGE